mgnify:CR=1 FL=1
MDKNKMKYGFHNFSNTEIYFNEFIDKIAKYFEIGCCGINDMKIHKNSIYFYSSINFWDFCRKCPLQDRCEKDVILIFADDCEELGSVSLESREDYVGNSIIARYKDEYIYLGFWCEYYHHLNLCDFPYTQEKAKLFAKLFSQIAEKLSLKKIENNNT